MLDVDVAALRVMAIEVAGAAATLRETGKTAGAGLAPPAEAGSTASTAAQSAEKAWLPELERLTARVDGLSRTMTTAADSYEAADQANADGLRHTGRGMT